MKPSCKNRLNILLVAGMGLIASVWLFRGPLREHLRDSATLANDSPPPEVVSEMIEQAADPRLALLAAWNSGKVMHRETAVREVAVMFPQAQPLPADIEAVLVAGATDLDMNVRETALGTLQSRRDPALPALAAAQFTDPDSAARLLGLTHLAAVPASVGVPLVVGLLDDPSLEVEGETLKLLEHWSGMTFGSRLADALPSANPQSGLLESAAPGRTRIQAATVRAKAWWATHQQDFPTGQPMPAVMRSVPAILPAKDFTLRTLQGDKVRLSDFRGKVVLINFWTTWCTACVGEVPELVALQKEHRDGLVILGVSLDFVPDDDGDQQPDPAAARQKVARAIQERGISYPVLLDEHNAVGGCFNGGELPTTVIIDAAGNLRRRFVGARSLPEFEAMVAAAGKPLPPPSNSSATIVSR